MFIIKDRHHLLVLGKRVGDAFKKTSSRMEDLALVITRIGAMLSDADHPIHGNCLGADGDGTFNRVEDRYVIFFSHRPG